MIITGAQDVLLQLLSLPQTVWSRAKDLICPASPSQHHVVFVICSIFTSLQGKNVCPRASAGTSKWGLASGCYSNKSATCYCKLIEDIIVAKFKIETRSKLVPSAVSSGMNCKFKVSRNCSRFTLENVAILWKVEGADHSAKCDNASLTKWGNWAF